MRPLALAAAALPGNRSAAAVDDPRADERALVGRAQEGDLAAFETLYRRHVPRVHALCWRLAEDPAAAEELVQEVFVRAWAKLGGFRAEAAFGSWLHMVAVHAALDERRARRRAPRTVDEAGENRPAPRGPGEAESGFDLGRALRTLPARARAVFVLHDVEGYRHDEIAQMLGVDEGTSKSQLHRARRLLREALR